MREQSETNELDDWVAALQQALYEREQAVYSATVLAEARHPHNLQVMDTFDGYGLVTGPCGDTMEYFVQLDGERIARATYMTDGCGATVACGSMLSRMVEGRRLVDAEAIEAADLIIALDGLPPEHIHCATLAVNTLQQAMADCRPASN